MKTIIILGDNGTALRTSIQNVHLCYNLLQSLLRSKLMCTRCYCHVNTRTAALQGN